MPSLSSWHVTADDGLLDRAVLCESWLGQVSGAQCVGTEAGLGRVWCGRRGSWWGSVGLRSLQEVKEAIALGSESPLTALLSQVLVLVFRLGYWSLGQEVSLLGMSGVPNLKKLRNGKGIINPPPGQSYEIRLLENRKLGDFQDLNTKYVKSIIRVVFHDRRLQYTEHQQLEGWRWSRPGDRILDIDIPLSVGILDPRASPTQLNAVEFLWDPSKRASAFIQVHCISTEFTPRKHGGEKGVPFRVQIDTFKQNENGEYMEHLHSASCQIKVFKPKGADRKQKTDREKMEKRTAQEKEKYQPSYETTILTECSPWPDVAYQVNSAPSPSYNGSPSSFGLGEGVGGPPDSCLNGRSSCEGPAQFLLWPLCCSSQHLSNPPGGGLAPGRRCKCLWPGFLAACPRAAPKHHLKAPSLCLQHLLPSASIQDAQQWLHRNRFSQFCRLFASFSGADLLKMSRDDLVQICGPADGIRLFNAIKGRNVRPKMTIYVCQELEQNRIPLQQKRDGGGDSNLCVMVFELTVICAVEKGKNETVFLYHAIFLEELTTLELIEKIANLYSIAPQHIHRVYRQGPTGIHVVVSNEMVQNFQDESCFILSTLKAESNDGYHIILKCGL
ncbi:hypothetical protein MC885_006543 [Smutsia gigantea]|nr:hypothetical protein MC885_006543 [Smutsia gigantea]